jgi:hypothetical protein
VVITSSTLWQRDPSPEITSSTLWQRRYREQTERYRERYREQARQRDAAEERARLLLYSLLTEEQQRTLEQDEYFTVVGGTTRKIYRITFGYSQNIYTRNEEDVELMVCCHLSDRYPYYDHMVAQLLGLRFNEEIFLSVANIDIRYS